MATYARWAARPQVTVAGEDVIWYFQVRDDSDAVVDITGWTFTFYATDQRNASNTITVSNSDFTIIDADAGLAKFTIARATTLSQGNHVFRGSLWRTNSGAQKELATGDWKVMPTVRT